MGPGTDRRKTMCNQAYLSVPENSPSESVPVSVPIDTSTGTDRQKRECILSLISVPAFGNRSRIAGSPDRFPAPSLRRAGTGTGRSWELNHAYIHLLLHVLHSLTFYYFFWNLAEGSHPPPPTRARKTRPEGSRRGSSRSSEQQNGRAREHRKESSQPAACSSEASLAE